MTAEQLLQQLNKDPSYLARQERSAHRIEQEEALWKEAFRPYVVQINGLGFPGESFEEILLLNAPLPQPITGVLLKAATELTDPRHVEMIVRALSGSAEIYDGAAITRVFDTTDDEPLKWACINTIATSPAANLDHWLAELPEYWIDVLRGCRTNRSRK